MPRFFSLWVRGSPNEWGARSLRSGQGLSVARVPRSNSAKGLCIFSKEEIRGCFAPLSMTGMCR